MTTRFGPTRFCPRCQGEQPVEQPPCPDGHLDCPEWICLSCDHVFVGGWLAVDAAPAAGERLARTA
ncbi:MAG TPA: hypothetical protein VG708_05585 [Mycobacteriales bacterium]|nr:hypothetical protein [Mycobacteriales bacterium]